MIDLIVGLKLELIIISLWVLGAVMMRGMIELNNKTQPTKLESLRGKIAFCIFWPAIALLILIMNR